MQTVNSLSRKMVEPPLPDPISLWPQTLASQLLWLVLLCAVVYFAGKAIQRYKANRYRRVGLNSIEAIDISQPGIAVHELNKALKQVAATAFGSNAVAPLYGSEWLDYLTRTSSVDFGSETAIRWQQSLFDPSLSAQVSRDDLVMLIKLAVRWVKTHQVGDHV